MKLLDQVVMPALSAAEQAFATALSRINIEELARSAEEARKSGSGRRGAACADPKSLPRYRRSHALTPARRESLG